MNRPWYSYLNKFLSVREDLMLCEGSHGLMLLFAMGDSGLAEGHTAM